MALKSSNKVDTNRYQLEVEIDGASFEKAVDQAYRKQNKNCLLYTSCTFWRIVVCYISIWKPPHSFGGVQCPDDSVTLKRTVLCHGSRGMNV